MADNDELDLSQFQKKSTAPKKAVEQSENVKQSTPESIKNPMISKKTVKHTVKPSKDKKREKPETEELDTDPDENELDAIAELLETVKKQYQNQTKNRRMKLIYRIIERFLKRNNYTQEGN